LLRNGWDYLSYQQYERALDFFREAESRQKELTPAELKTLKEGITRCQQAMRAPADRVAPSYARTKKNRPGSFVAAAAPTGDPKVVTTAGSAASNTAVSGLLADPKTPGTKPYDPTGERAAAVSRAILPALPDETLSAFPRQPTSISSESPAPATVTAPPPAEDLAASPLPATLSPVPDNAPASVGSTKTPVAASDSTTNAAIAPPEPLPDQDVKVVQEPASKPAPSPEKASDPAPVPALPAEELVSAPLTSTPPAPESKAPLTASTPDTSAPAAAALPPAAPPTDPVLTPAAASSVAPTTLVPSASRPSAATAAAQPKPIAVTTAVSGSDRASDPEALPPLPPAMYSEPAPAATPTPASPVASTPPVAVQASKPNSTAPSPALDPLTPLPVGELDQPAVAPTANLPALPADVPKPETVSSLPTAPSAPPPPPATLATPESVPAPAAEVVAPQPAADPAPRQEPQRNAASPFDQASAAVKERSDFRSTLNEELQREVERIAQAQEAELQRQTPQPPQPGRAPGSETRRAPEELEGMGVSNIPPSTRLELPRAPSPTEARPIRAIPVPEEFVPLPARQWEPTRKYWAAAATCHLPLYFHNAALERYGQSAEQFFGPVGRYLSYPIDDPTQSNQRNQLAQGFISIGQFAVQIALWPYNLIVDPPWESEYDLGYYRPGDRIPPDTIYVPLTGVGPPLHGKQYGLPPGH
jgi:hypothetical protein